MKSNYVLRWAGKPARDILKSLPESEFRPMPLLTVKLIYEFVVCICSSFVLLYFRQRAIMLTPAFSIEQDGKHLTIHVKAPLAKVYVNSVVDRILGTLGRSHVIVIYLPVP